MKETDCEKNRYVMKNSFEDGKPVGDVLMAMQNELLPTIASNLINIDYQIEALIIHDSTFGDGKEVPPIQFPVIISRDPEGAFDVGQEGMVAQQMQQQQQFYAA